MKVNAIIVFGRRWFDGANTYHSSNVYVIGTTADGKERVERHRISFTPGYGEQFIETAADWLDENGFTSRQKHANGSTQQLWQFCQEQNIIFIYDVVDVARRKDL